LNSRLLSLMLLGMFTVAAAPAHASAAGASAAEGRQSVRTFQDIRFTGNTRLSSRKLLQVIGIKAGGAYTREAVDGALTKIVDAYKAIGSDMAIKVDIALPDATHARVNFLIDESGTGGNQGAAPRSGARSGGVPPPPPPAMRQ
jgi:hypothetical protein